jgi:AcrR family transcriptional regulator
LENDAVTAIPVSAGRPRDPEVNRRITQAALDLFGEAGWAGFAMEAVARRAGVGKASVYLRWSTKEALLTDAVTRRLTRVTDADTGTLRGDLTELAAQMLELYAGRDSQAVLRLHVEAAAIPGVAEHYAAVRRSQVLAARAIVRRGIRRGKLTAATSVTIPLDTLAGGAMMHVLSTPPDLKAGLARDLRTYAEHLVSFLLRAVAVTDLSCPPPRDVGSVTPSSSSVSARPGSRSCSRTSARPTGRRGSGSVTPGAPADRACTPRPARSPPS